CARGGSLALAKTTVAQPSASAQPASPAGKTRRPLVERDADIGPDPTLGRARAANFSRIHAGAEAACVPRGAAMLGAMPGARTLPSLSVVVPCHDESATIEAVVRDALHHAGEVASRYEVIVVDDGSR